MLTSDIQTIKLNQSVQKLLVQQIRGSIANARGKVIIAQDSGLLDKDEHSQVLAKVGILLADAHEELRRLNIK